ncbi:MAG: hypothetical protein AAGC64_11010 [Bacteroidota bacterium]
MKRILISGSMVFFSVGIVAQGLSMEAFIQKSLIGLQKGYGLYYLNKKGWGLGIIFQSTDGTSMERKANNYPLLAIEGRIPIQSCERLRLQFAPRLGFVNHDFFVFIPEFQTEYELTKTIGIGLGAGIRVREASMSYKIFIKPFKERRNGNK